MIGGRFDHHQPPKAESKTRAVLYGAINASGDEAIATCLVEAFQSTRTIDRSTDSPYLVAFLPTRALRLLDLRLSWPSRAGVTQSLNNGPHGRSHAWSRRIYAAYDEIDGLIYPSAVAGIAGANVLLFERARTALPAYPELNLPLSHVALTRPLGRIAGRFGYILV
jgi:hypothetical protein